MSEKHYTADEIIYYLTKSPEKTLIAELTRDQQDEVAKARARLHRMTGSFGISARTVATAIHIWRTKK